MNGEHGTLYESINELKVQMSSIEVKQAERHAQNMRMLEKLEKLPCTAHESLIINNKYDINRVYKWLWAVVLAVLATAFGHLMGNL